MIAGWLGELSLFIGSNRAPLKQPMVRPILREDERASCSVPGHADLRCVHTCRSRAASPRITARQSSCVSASNPEGSTRNSDRSDYNSVVWRSGAPAATCTPHPPTPPNLSQPICRLHLLGSRSLVAQSHLQLIQPRAITCAIEAPA